MTAGGDLVQLDGLARRLRADAVEVDDVRAAVRSRVGDFLAGALELRPDIDDHHGPLGSAVRAVERLQRDVEGVRDALAHADRGGVLRLAALWELEAATSVDRAAAVLAATDVGAVWRPVADATRGLLPVGQTLGDGARSVPVEPAVAARIAGRMWATTAEVAPGLAPGIERASDVVSRVLSHPAVDAGGRAVGVMGAVGDGARAYRAFEAGDHGRAAGEAAKAVLGVASMVPGPVGVAATAVSLGILVYENRDAIANRTGQVVGAARRLVDGLF